MAHFQVPVNLPHAATIVGRIEARLAIAGVAERDDAEKLRAEITELRHLLAPYGLGDDPSEDEAADVIRQAAEAARRAVDEIERLTLGEDRLGQAVRNLFECLGLGQEGSAISLRAGENPNSLTRPV